MPSDSLRAALRAIWLRAWRLHLETPGVFATVPMLRGVWGAALHEFDQDRYQTVFGAGASPTARYVLRPAAPDVVPAPAVEWVLFGEPDPSTDAAMWAAWERAAALGLGPDRRPFRLVEARPLAWDGTALSPGLEQPGFSLEGLPWPAGDPDAGSRLRFPAPLRLLRDGRLIHAPTPADLALAALRRLHALAGPAAEPLWHERRAWLNAARGVEHTPWRGHRLDLVRYSGAQRRELELRGVAGDLDLPTGAGGLAPLLSAACWIHLGKGTVMGLGQLVIEPLDT